MGALSQREKVEGVSWEGEKVEGVPLSRWEGEKVEGVSLS